MKMDDEAKTSLENSNEGLKINLEQMQLNELQKISSQLQSQKISGAAITTGTIGPNPMQTSFSGVTINGRPAGGVINTQPMQANGVNYGLPTNYNTYTPPPYTQNILGQAINMGAMALSTAVAPQNRESISSTLKEMRENNQTFFEKTFNKIADNPLIKYHTIDYSRTSDKGVEAIQEQANFAVQRGALDVASAGASIVGGGIGAKAGAGIGAAIGTAILPGVGTAVGSIAGSMLGFGAGSAVGSGGVGLIKHEVQDRQDYSTWLQENAYKFINSMETNNTKVNSGFTGDERKQLGKWLANMNVDFNMTDDEINTILQGVTDAGLLKSSSDMESFQKKFSSLVSTIKEGAKLLNLSYEEMTEMVGDMNKQGIKSDADRELMLNKLKAVSDLTGMDVSTLYQNADSLQSLLYGGTAVSPTSGLANSTTLTALGSSFMDEMSKQMSGDNKEAYQQMYGTLYNTALNNGWDGATLGQNMAQISGNFLDYNSTTGQVALPLLAYAANFEGGVITGFNQDKLNEINSYLQQGDLNGAQQLFNQWQSSDENAASIVNQLTSKSGQQVYGLLINNLGASGTSQFMNNYLDALAYSDGLIKEEDRGTSAGAAILADHMGLGAENGKMLYQYNDYINSEGGQAVLGNVEQNEQKNQIRRNSSSNESVGFWQGLQNKWESLKQGITDGATSFASNLPFSDTITDFMTGQDSAQREGYGSASYSAESYQDVYDALSSYSNLTEKLGVNTDTFKVTDHTNDEVQSTWFKHNVQLEKAKSNSFGTKDIKKLVEGSELSDKEKQEIIDNLTKSEGQTQSAVAAYLDIVQDVGGDDYRKSFVKNFDLKGYGLGMNIDDLAKADKIGSLTIDQQKQIQDQLPKLVAEQLSRDYSSDDLMKEFADIYTNSDSLKKSEIYAKAIEDNKLDTGEIEQLISEMQKTAYTTTGEDISSAFAKDAENYLNENGEQLDKINKALKSNNNSTEETVGLLKQNNEKQEKINQQLQNQVKSLEQRVTSLSK